MLFCRRYHALVARHSDVILGIETSCDETAAAVVVAGRDVLSNVVSSQVDLHEKYGGVVPEIAARAHLERVNPIVREALRLAGVEWTDVEAIAVTDGPGLVGSLLIGGVCAKTLALLRELPLVAVDHIEAHATSAALAFEPPTKEAARSDPTRAQRTGASRAIAAGGAVSAAGAGGAAQADAASMPAPGLWPAVALVVSGGHTSLYLVRDFLNVELLGQTVDDAAGEAFDKVASILGLGFPGGPAIERAARGGDAEAHRFPRAWLDEPHFNFSYSGLKTAVLYHVYGAGNKYGSAAGLSPAALADVAASFQAAAVEPLVRKTVAAARKTGVGRVVIGGGVAANSLLREELTRACAEDGLALTLTPLRYCTDNAAMIAALGYHRLRAGLTADLWLEARGGLIRPAR